MFFATLKTPARQKSIIAGDNLYFVFDWLYIFKYHNHRSKYMGYLMSSKHMSFSGTTEVTGRIDEGLNEGQVKSIKSIILF